MLQYTDAHMVAVIPCMVSGFRGHGSIPKRDTHIYIYTK